MVLITIIAMTITLIVEIAIARMTSIMMMMNTTMTMTITTITTHLVFDAFTAITMDLITTTPSTWTSPIMTRTTHPG